MKADGDQWRRVVPSPEPVRIIEQETIRTLAGEGGIVVRGGGRGARPAAIGALADAAEILTGQAGTTITPYAQEGQR